MRYLISFAIATVCPFQPVHIDPTISIQFISTKVFCQSLDHKLSDQNVRRHDMLVTKCNKDFLN